jgi:hypothetical protein
VIAFTETCNVADVDTTVALSAPDFCVRHKLAKAPPPMRPLTHTVPIFLPATAISRDRQVRFETS